MAYSFFQRALAAAANQRLPDPPKVSDVVARIRPSFADPTKWHHKSSNHYDTDLHGPARINIRVYNQALPDAFYYLTINGDDIKLNETDRSEVAQFVHDWWTWEREQRRQNEKRLQRETESRIDAHLSIYNL
jgi:hypothetical protein